MTAEQVNDGRKGWR
ncbi:hypothetical protein CL3_22950 [butyrate-producing bacterium SM4/1]|nr:hypothetical protein CLS_10260 [[Clostridium] cf. saccharolyticum K10]CBL36552.1 hypothetical protein CL3_22950 [butyrate-producing bacterium SM4/1]